MVSDTAQVSDSAFIAHMSALQIRTGILLLETPVSLPHTIESLQSIHRSIEALRTAVVLMDGLGVNRKACQSSL